MPLPQHSSPFPALSLPEEDRRALRRLAKSMVADLVEDYELYLWHAHGKLNQAAWTLVREKEDVHVYQSRRASTNGKTQELLAVGSLLGQLDDALYGVMAPTTDDMRLLAAYTKERVSNCAVLTTIKNPTPGKPFHSVTLKWLVSGGSGHWRGLSKKRDYVLLDATGTMALSNGEMVGYHIQHSINLKHALPLPHYSRSEMTACSLWRQKTDDRVQVYAKTFVQGDKHSLLVASPVRAAADAMLSSSRVIQCAQMKKLAWLMRCKSSVLNTSRGSNRLRSSMMGGSDHRSQSMSYGGCEICTSQLMATSGRRGTAKAVCIVCGRHVCTTCRVKRELCTIMPDRRLLEQRVAFCVPCHSIAVRASAADVASEEASRSSPPRSRFDASEHLFVLDEFDSASGRKSLPSSSMRGTLELDDLEISPLSRPRSASDLPSAILGDA